MNKPFTDSTELLREPDALRARMATEGYLFIRNLVPRPTLDELYAAILAICQREGWADDEGHAQGEPRLEGSPEFWSVYDALQSLESFHALAHRPELLAIIETLVQERPLVHPRNIARISFPHAEHFTTPAHQDFVHVQGAAATYTAWFPLCDCPCELGSLLVLAGSHTHEVLPVFKASGAGGLSLDTEQLDHEWHGSDFAAGDVLFFHSYTVHKALPNRTANQLRISVDFRYQGLSQPIVEDGLLPHYNRLGWEAIYQGWTRPELQYYWQDLGVTTVPRDRSYHQNAPMRAM
ncbi:MAG: phytanoyl-CoA dioxygenase family protein [Caldilineaceae bacterium]